jgi:hypothetical protein
MLKPEGFGAKEREDRDGEERAEPCKYHSQNKQGAL